MYVQYNFELIPDLDDFHENAKDIIAVARFMAKVYHPLTPEEKERTLQRFADIELKRQQYITQNNKR